MPEKETEITSTFFSQGKQSDAAVMVVSLTGTGTVPEINWQPTTYVGTPAGHCPYLSEYATSRAFTSRKTADPARASTNGLPANSFGKRETGGQGQEPRRRLLLLRLWLNERLEQRTLLLKCLPGLLRRTQRALCKVPRFGQASPRLRSTLTSSRLARFCHTATVMTVFASVREIVVYWCVQRFPIAGRRAQTGRESRREPQRCRHESPELVLGRRDIGGVGAPGVEQKGGAGGQRDQHHRERPLQAGPAAAEDVVGHGPEQQRRQ